jgi:uncharacterized protein (TIGR02266 family)
MTPKTFAKLPKQQMFAELRRLGIVHGEGNSKAELVRYFEEWFLAQAPPEFPVDEATERRSSHRARIEVEIGIRTETNFFVGFSGDLSEGGIFVATVSLLPTGTPVSLSFSFPGGIRVDAEGEVAWTREGVAFDSELEPGMEIRFTHVSSDAVAAIQEFMKIREPIFHAD